MHRSSPALLGLALVLAAAPLSLRAVDFYSTGPGQGAADTLDDVWQGLFNAWGMSPTADDDHDGCSNYVESLAGTDPRNPKDCLAVGNMAISSNSVVITFVAEKGKQYQVWESDSPTGAPPAVGWSVVPGTLKISTADHVNDSIVFNKPANTSKFYRLETRDTDTDGDGVSDWAENKTGTNPSVFSSSGDGISDGERLHSMLTLTATVAVANGFERDDKTLTTPAAVPAKINLTRTYGTMALTIPFSGSGGAPDATKANASGSDYTVPGSIASKVTIPANQGVTGTPFKVDVLPVQNAVDQVPRYLKMTFNLPGAAPGTPQPNATVCICDADPANPNNNQLFVAYLGKEAGATTTATGIATALVSGDNTSAAVNLTFSNLTSSQRTNETYIRYGTGIGSEVIPTAMPNGQVTGFSWTILAKASIGTDQGMFDSLNSGSIFVSIPTDNFNPGTGVNSEIKGYFNRATGSTTFDANNPNLVAPTIGSAGWVAPTGTDLDREIYRFLEQSTFGGTTALHDDILNNYITPAISGGGTYIDGLRNWLNVQMDSAQTPSVSLLTLVQAADNEDYAMRGNRPLTQGNDPQYNNGLAYGVTYDANGMPTISTTASTTQNSNNYPAGAANRKREWWSMVTQCKDQVRQRMALALHEIVVTSDIDQTLNDRHYGHANYWDMLATGAFGKYRTLLENVSYSPIMGVYLSHITNRSTYDAGGGLFVSPDENYAREIMQLFSIGLVLRHPDGSLVLDAGGLPIATYDQNDITELARVMTGWSHGARHSNATVQTWNGTAYATGQQRVSPVIELNGTTSTWFGRDDGLRFFQAPWIYPMKLLGRTTVSGVANTVVHDFGQKTLFSGKVAQTTIPAQVITGMTDTQTHAAAQTDMTIAHNTLAGDPTSNTAYNGHPNTPTNISRWLIQRLTTSNPSAGYIYRVSKKYSDTNGNLGEVLKAILLDYEARSLTLADASISFGKIKEPMIHFANVLRSLHAFSGAPMAILRDNPPPFGTLDAMLPGGYPATEVAKFSSENVNPPSLPAGWGQGPFRFRINDTTGNIGQAPQHAPSVFNYFLPDYVEPGPMAAAGLFAPELQIATESTEFNRINFHWAYTWSNLVGMSTQPGADTSVSDFTISSAFATPTVRFSLDGGVTSTNSVNFVASDFTQGDGSALKTITLSGFNTGLLTGTTAGNIQFTLGGTAAAYTSGSVSVPPLPMTFVDNELPNEGLVITESNGNTWVQEGGKSDTFTVMLSSPPQAGATVSVNLSVSAQATLDLSTLNFDSNNWSTPQTVTVSAVADAIPEAPGAGDAAVTFSTSSTLASWNSLTAASIPVHVVEGTAAGNTYDVLVTETGSPVANIVTETSTSTPTAALPFDTYQLRLTKNPTANVTVTITCDAQTQVNSTGTTWATSTTRVFVPTGTTPTTGQALWDTGFTITLRGNQDTTQEGIAASTSTSAVTHSIVATAGGYTAGQAIQPLSVTVNDDDNRIILAHSGIDTRVQEGGFTDTITVVLRQFVNGSTTSATPTANVMVSLGSTGVQLNPSVLTFTPGNAFSTQTVTVTATDDWPSEGLHNASIFAYAYSTDTNYNGHGSSNSNLGATLIASIVDNDNAQVLITESGGSTVVIEGYPADTYTLALSTPPTAPVTLALTASSQLTVTPTTFTFDTTNWNTPQTVTVSATNDTTAETDGPAFIVTAITSTDSKYNGRTVRTLNPTIIDNDPPLTIAQTNGFTTVAENGTVGTSGTPNVSDTFTVLLPKTPTANVTVTLTTDGQTTVSPSTLTFTTANFGTAQTVTVNAVDDVSTETTPHNGTISFNIASTDPYYNGNAAPPIYVSIKDNDAPGVSIIESSGTTISTESATGSTSDTYTIVLTKAPTANVVVRVTCDGQTEVNTSGSTYAATRDFTFTSANWFTAQTVTVRAKDDTVAELRHRGDITHIIVAGSAIEYVGIAIAPVVMMITDNDNAVAANKVQIVESSSSTVVSESGTSDTYTVVLSAAPTSNVTVTLTPDSQLTVSPSVLTFTSANYSVAQTVTVRAAENALIETSPLYGGLLGANPHLGTITHAAASSDAAYNAISIATVTASINDNDAPRVIVTESGGNTSIAEGGATDTYTLALSQQPAADVTVSITPDVQSTVSAGSVTFTSANWATPQTITVTAVDDATAEATFHTSVITHATTSSDGIWKNISVKPVSASVLDNDGARIVPLDTGGSTVVTEGSAINDTFTLKVFPPPGGFGATDTLTVNLVSPLYIIPVPQYSKQVGYFNFDVTPSGVTNNNQRDRIVMDYTEIIDLYRTTFYGSIMAANGGSLPPTPTSVQVQNGHWAASKAIVDRFDLWWAGGRMKAKYPILVEPNQTPPTPTPAMNPRQTIIEAIYYHTGGTSLPATTRYANIPTYDPKTPPSDTFSTDIRDRARYAAYLVSSLSPTIIAH